MELPSTPTGLWHIRIPNYHEPKPMPEGGHWEITGNIKVWHEHKA